MVGNTLINYNSNGLNASVSCGAGLDNNAGSIYWVDSLPNNKVDSTCDYLIVTHRNFFIDTNARNEIEALAQHRADFNGFDVAMVRTSTIDTFINVYPEMSMYEKIHYLIKETYESNNANHTYDGKLAYVNLFGDAFFGNNPNEVCIPTYSEGYDIYFTQLTYDTINGQVVYDPYPDIMIGRCSVDDTEQVQNVVHKIMNFKPEKFDYKYYMLTLATSDDFYPQQSAALMAMDEILPDYFNKKLMLDPGFNQPYPAWDLIPYGYQPLVDSLAKGYMFVNYMDHGGTTLWVHPTFEFSDINSSLYDTKLPFIVSGACFTGAFQSTDDCMAEQFLSNHSSRGAIGFFAASEETGALAIVVEDYYSTLIGNSSFVIAEAVLEMKIKYGSSLIAKQYNLFGDPALNILHENIDTLKPDIRVENINLKSKRYKTNDRLILNVAIKNTMNADVDTAFTVHCLVRQLSDSSNYLSAVYSFDSLPAFTIDSAQFKIHLSFEENGYYKVSVTADTANAVDELNKYNNFKTCEIYINNAVCLSDTLKVNDRIIPLSYCIIDTMAVDQVIAEAKILDYNGNTIVDHNLGCTGFSSVGKSVYNDEAYVCSYLPQLNVFSYTTDSMWTTSVTGGAEQYGHSIIAAIDNSGEEYIFVCKIDQIQSFWEYSFYCYDYQMNKKWSINKFHKIPVNIIGLDPAIITPLSYYDSQNEKHNIVMASPNGHLYFVSENSSGQPFISDSLTLPACNKLNSSIVAGDISGNGMQLALCYIDTINNQCLAVIDAGSLQSDTAHINSPGVAGPWICDFDNDGAMDLVLAAPNQGYYVFDEQLNGTFHADSLFRNFVGFCDISNDGTFEIIYEQSRGKYHFLVGKNISDSLIFELPLPGVNNTYWFGDKEKNGRVDMLSNEMGTLFNYEFPVESKTWSWKGFRGNVKNNGNFLQPAYCKANDTVYWSDNISMPAAFEIPYRTTVIIKPGTHIFATDDAQLMVYGKLIAEGTESHPILFSANIMTDSKNYWQGITLGNGSASSLKYVEISNAEFGILYQDFASQSLLNSTFDNNLVGVGAFNASPQIYQCTFTGNTKAIASYSNGSPVLAGLTGELQYKNTLVNNTTGIYLASASVYLNYGYNDIYNHPASGYYVFSTGALRVAAAQNYWGSGNGGDIQAHLYPQNYILIDPVCTSPNTGFKSADPVKDLLEEAYINLEEGAINEAEVGFMQIIADYPLHNEAYLSVPGLFACYHATGNNWINLETCLTGLYNDSTSTLDKNLLFGYLNLCLRQQGKYAEAIANYESIILKNPRYNDSVFAVINIGNTYREAGNLKSTLGTLDFLRPASDAAHVELTIDLLQTLHEEQSRPQPDATAENHISEVFPNPVSGQLTIKYVSSSASVAIFQISDVSGRILKNYPALPNQEGENIFILNTDFLNPGVYYISLMCKGQNNSTRKIVVME